MANNAGMCEPEVNPQSLSSALLRQSLSLNWKLSISARHAGQNVLGQQDHIPIKNLGAKGMSSGARGINFGSYASTSTSSMGHFSNSPGNIISRFLHSKEKLFRKMIQ